MFIVTHISTRPSTDVKFFTNKNIASIAGLVPAEGVAAFTSVMEAMVRHNAALSKSPSLIGAKSTLAEDLLTHTRTSIWSSEEDAIAFRKAHAADMQTITDARDTYNATNGIVHQVVYKTV